MLLCPNARRPGPPIANGQYKPRHYPGWWQPRHCSAPHLHRLQVLLLGGHHAACAVALLRGWLPVGGAGRCGHGRPHRVADDAGHCRRRGRGCGHGVAAERGVAAHQLLAGAALALATQCCGAPCEGALACCGVRRPHTECGAAIRVVGQTQGSLWSAAAEAEGWWACRPWLRVLVCRCSWDAAGGNGNAMRCRGSDAHWHAWSDAHLLQRNRRWVRQAAGRQLHRLLYCSPDRDLVHCNALRRGRRRRCRGGGRCVKHAHIPLHPGEPRPGRRSRVAADALAGCIDRRGSAELHGCQ